MQSRKSKSHGETRRGDVALKVSPPFDVDVCTNILMFPGSMQETAMHRMRCWMACLAKFVPCVVGRCGRRASVAGSLDLVAYTIHLKTSSRYLGVFCGLCSLILSLFSVDCVM